MTTWLPEDVRGGWYHLPADASPRDDLEEEGQIVHFDLNGDYTAYEIDEGHRRETETGGYTFDGDFLILRGGRTETFRAEPRSRWHVDLESKSDETMLLRGPYTSGELQRSISEEEVDEVRRMPAKVLVRSATEGDLETEVVTFIDERRGAEGRVLGAASMQWESDDQSTMWIGVTPAVDGLGLEIWRSLVREAYLDVYLGEPGGLERVALALFTDPEKQRLEFRYGAG